MNSAFDVLILFVVLLILGEIALRIIEKDMHSNKSQELTENLASQRFYGRYMFWAGVLSAGIAIAAVFVV